MMSSKGSIRSEIKATLLLAGPIIGASIVQVANGFIDTVMLGRFDSLHLAAGALGASLWMFIVLVGAGFSMGVTPIVAQLNGAGETRKIAKTFQQGAWLCLFLAVIMFFCLRSFTHLFDVIGTEPSIVPLASDYLKIVSWGVAISQLYMAGLVLSDGIEYTRPMMMMQLMLLPLNALGNYLLIFGNWGFPALGVIGAAIATSITLGLSLLLMLINLKFNKRYQLLALFENFRGPDFKVIGEILVISIPIGIASLLEASLFTAVSLLMGKLGVLALAGHQIAINYASLMFMFPLGFSIAATIRVGNAVGRRDYEDARQRGWVAISMSGIFMICSAIMLLLFHQQIAQVYTNDSEVISAAVGLLVLAGLFQIPDGIQVSAIGALRGYKDTTVPMFVGLLGYWIIGFPCAYYLGIVSKHGATGLWWGLIVGLSITAVLLVNRYRVLSSNYSG